ncbi:MAG: hypothetical protein ABIN74_13035 [Ferruginibacter sp.]
MLQVLINFNSFDDEIPAITYYVAKLSQKAFLNQEVMCTQLETMIFMALFHPGFYFL